MAAAGIAPTALQIPTAVDETIIPTWGLKSLVSLPDPGYQIGELIGRGGMGEVVAAQDQRIGREVAVKRIRALDPSPDAVTRFLREARIQARLDHPAIVPVYELGTDEKGRPYFTMKRLAGETLGKKLLRGGPVQPLLRAFVDVCLAIQLAHSRGVVHRDLKPSNIMLGDYGEVYVLDWGVARVLTDRKRTTQPSMAAEVDDNTTAGSILGTPGYMAPEQVRGFEADTQADIYALGAILFEILTGEALHPRGEAALSSTLTQPQEMPTRRAADRKQIAPELDKVCFDALAEEPKERPTARELADRVQAYLDGDRDTERRKQLAAEQVAAAHEALKADPKSGRAAAMRRASRALGLDPECTDAAELISALTLEPPPPDQYPPDLKKFISKEEKAVNSSRAKQGMWTYIALAIMFCIALPFMHVKSWGSVLAFDALLVLGAVISYNNSRRGYSNAAVTLVMTGLVGVLFTRISGPFILTPIILCTALMQLSAIRPITDHSWIAATWAVVVVMVPLILEWLGVIHQTYAVGQGVVASVSDVFDMRGGIDESVLVVANCVFIAAAGVVAVFISRRRQAAQRQLLVQAWHLQQMLPTEKRWQTEPLRNTKLG
jgi:serine/threonine-protein kinase